MLTQIDGLLIFHLQVFFRVHEFHVSAFTKALKGKADGARQQCVRLFYFSCPKFFVVISLHIMYISNMIYLNIPFMIRYIISYTIKKIQQKNSKNLKIGSNCGG